MQYALLILSGNPGSGKSTLAKRLSALLGWPVYSLGAMYREDWLRRYPNAEVSFEEYWRATTPEEALEKNRRARERLKLGNIIGDSRYTVPYSDLPALFLFVTAELGVRVERNRGGGRYGTMTRDAVEQLLRDRERDELRMGKELFGRAYDYRDFQHYHCVLNAGKLSVDQEAAIVLRLLRGENTSSR